MKLFTRAKASSQSVTGRTPLWPPSKFSLRQYAAIVGGLLVIAGGVALFAAAPPPATQPIPVGHPYIDAAQLLPYPKTSFYNQPWRGYMETVPATTLLGGIGTVYAPPANMSAAQQDKNLQYMSSVGVRAIRKEVDWATIDPANEGQFTSSAAARNAITLTGAQKAGITPTILLNANDGAPEPSFSPALKATLVHSTPVGATQMTVTGVKASDIVVHKPNTATGGSGTGDGDNNGIRAHRLFTKVVTNKDGSVTLTFSRPTLIALDAGAPIHIQYLKYLPLYPVGTPEFNNTMSGWNNYIKATANMIKAAGLPKVNFEIWNEETFGSAFLDANNYYAASAPVNTTGIDKMHPGGQAWEMANQTIQYLKATFGDNATVDWGFSNSNGYKTAVVKLPPNTGAESFHPYGQGLVSLGKTNVFSLNNLVEGPYVPQVSRQLPEGGYLLGSNVLNFITGKLQPAYRYSRQPAGTSHFQYWFTESGFSPGNNHQTHSVAENDLLKSKAMLRALNFWLNKGLSQYDYGTAYKSDKKLNNEATGNLLAYGAQNEGGSPVSPQAEALKNFTTQFTGATSLTAPRSLGVTVADVTPNDNTPQYNVFPADRTTKEPALHYRELFQFLPFQVTNNKFVIPAYVMSMNIVSPPPPMTFQVDITNVDGSRTSVTYFDPIQNQTVPITVVSKTNHDIVVQIEAIDYPRLIEITEKSATAAPTIRINAPKDGATLSGKVPVNLENSADTTKVQLQVDGVNLGQPLTQPPFKYTWDTSAVPNGTRSHVLSAVATNAAGISSTASVTVSIVNPDVFPPSAPNDLSSNGKTATSIELAWTNPSDNQGGSGIAGYHLYRDGKLIASPAGSTTQRTFYTDAKLTPSTTYVYTISAYDKAGNVSSLSAPVSLTTKAH